MIHTKLKSPTMITHFKLEEHASDSKTLIKRFPKYFCRVQYNALEFSNKLILSRLRRAKIIRTLCIQDFDRSYRDRVACSFIHQNKSIRSINSTSKKVLCRFPLVNTFFLSICNLSSWRSFQSLIHLKSLGLEFSSIFHFRPKQQKVLENLKYKFWKHLDRLIHLRNFSIDINHELSSEIIDFLCVLNSRKKFLCELDSFTILLNHVEIKQEYDLRFPDIYNYTTTLRIHEVPFITIKNFLKHLRDFKRLTFLSILKSTITHSNDQDAESIDFTFLGELEGLPRLTSLDLAINLSPKFHLQRFLNNFTLPNCLESMKLSFFETPWKSIFNTEGLLSESENIFSDNQYCLHFYKQWTGLLSLNSLALHFIETENYCSFSLYFVIPLLTQLSRLSVLHYSNWYSIEPKRKKPLNLNYLTSSIAHLKDSLRELYVENFAISIRKLQTDSNDFLRLKDLKLIGFVLGDVNIKELLHLYQDPKHESPQKSLEVSRLVIDKDKNFENFIHVLRRMPKTMRISLNVDMRQVSPSDFVNKMDYLASILAGRNLMRISFFNLNSIDIGDLEKLCYKLNEYGVFPDNINIVNKEASYMVVRDTNGKFCINTAIFDEGNNDEEEEDSSFYNSSSGDLEEDSNEDFSFEDISFDDNFDDIDEDV